MTYSMDNFFDQANLNQIKCPLTCITLLFALKTYSSLNQQCVSCDNYDIKGNPFVSFYLHNRNEHIRQCKIMVVIS